MTEEAHRLFFFLVFVISFIFSTNLLSAYEFKCSQQLASGPVATADREPGQTWGGGQGGLAYTPSHELISALHV